MVDAVLQETVKAWPQVSKTLKVPHSDVEYQRAVKTLDKLIDEVKNDEDHSLASLLEILAVIIEEYENEHYPMPEGKPRECLNLLMQEHGVHQKDLPEIGSQGVVSEILNGKRHLNTRQIKALSKRFNVSPSIFI